MKRVSARRGRLPPAVVPLALVVAAFAVAWVGSVPGGADRATRVWRGYETLLVSPARAEGGGLAEVVGALGPGVVSELTAPVAFWDFTGLASVPFAQLPLRIDPRDPRHDPAMDVLGGYFRAAGPDGNAWHVVFIPARGPAPWDYLRAAGRLGFSGSGWRLLEFDPLAALAGVAGMLVLSFLLARPGFRGNPVRAVAAAGGALLWIPYVACGGLARLGLALLLYCCWFRIVDVPIALRAWGERWRSEARGPASLFLAIAGAGLVLLIPAGGFHAGEVIALCGPVAGSVLLVAALARRPGGSAAPRRRKFEPVPIVRPAAPAPGQAAFLVCLGALLASAALTILGSFRVPSPVGVAGVRDFSWASLARLSQSRVADRLPDSGDLLTHEAYQETLAFGRPWGMPTPDERVYVRGFLIGADRSAIVAVQRRVKVFDDAWLRASLWRPPQGSVEAMLLAQGRPMAVGLRSSARFLGREAPVALLVLLVLSALLAGGDTEAASERGIIAPLMKNLVVRLNGAARRNQTP